MFLPVWLIVAILIISVLYVFGVKQTHKDNVHRVNVYIDRLKSEASWMEKHLANNFYYLTYHFIKHKNEHAKEIIILLKRYHDYHSLERAEWFIFQPDRFKDEIDAAIEDIHRDTGFDITKTRDDQQGYEWYQQEEKKYDEHLHTITELINVVRRELD